MSEHDYAALDDDELNRLIAERLGWRVAREVDGFNARAWLVDPDGRWHATVPGLASDDEVWEEAMHPNYMEPRPLADWANDLNAAITLTLPDSRLLSGRSRVKLSPGWSHTPPHAYWYAVYFVDELGCAGDYAGEDEQPARAICYAWLAGMAAREASDG